MVRAMFCCPHHVVLFLQENSKKLKMKFPTKIPNRKTKCKSAKTANSSNLNDSLDILRLDPSLSLTDTKIPQYQRAAAGNDCPHPHSAEHQDPPVSLLGLQLSKIFGIDFFSLMNPVIVCVHRSPVVTELSIR